MKKNGITSKTLRYLAALILITVVLQPIYPVLAISKSDSTKPIPVLMYHHLSDNVPAHLAKTIVTPREFEQQISYLKKAGYEAISMSQLQGYKNGELSLPAKPFLITFDDALESNYVHAFPILKKYNMKASFFVPTSYIGSNRGTENSKFTWEEARTMEKTGLIEIYNHGHDHVNHTKLSNKQIINNVLTAEKLLAKELGPKKTKAFAYPFGLANERTQNLLAKLGFNNQFLTDKGTALSLAIKTPAIKRITVFHGMSRKKLEASMKSYAR